MHLGNTYGSTKDCRNEKLAVKWLMADERTRREELDAGRYRTTDKKVPHPDSLIRSESWLPLPVYTDYTDIEERYRTQDFTPDTTEHVQHNKY